MGSERQTLTHDDEAPAPELPTQPYLVRGLSCDRPTVSPDRWSLVGAAEVVLSGAEPVTAASEPGLDGVRTIASGDRWASARHAVLRPSFGRWLIEDLGSKNGTLVNGERVSRAQLGDGARIEIGHTVWWFRAPRGDAPVADRVAIDLAAPFVTLHAPLELAVARTIAAVGAGLPVLVAGETGVGKERLVAAVHAGARRAGALIAVNCAALPAALVEGELFGHRRGAFSGALDDRIGYIRAADRGTLFLDEVGDMPPAAQASLLRVLAERTVTPLGAERAISVDLAVVSASHRELDAMVEQGQFRADLLARLRGISVWIPPLRDRPEDIAVFVARTLARVAPAATLQLDAMRRLVTAPWPGNVRELEHVVAAAALRAGARPIAAADLDGIAAPSPTVTVVAPPIAERSPADEALRARLVAALASHAGNISAVARALGRDRKQIHRWIARLGIDLRAPR